MLLFFIMFLKVPLARKPGRERASARHMRDKSRSTVSGKSKTKWGTKGRQMREEK